MSNGYRVTAGATFAALLAVLGPLGWAASHPERLAAPDGPLAPLSYVLAPYLELLSEASGTAWETGEHEYVIFLAEEGEPGTRERFFAAHPAIRAGPAAEGLQRLVGAEGGEVGGGVEHERRDAEAVAQLDREEVRRRAGQGEHAAEAAALLVALQDHSAVAARSR